MIAAVVPACGQSRRMGWPKLLGRIGGEPLIARVVAALRNGGAEPIYVVTAKVIQGAEQIGAHTRRAGASVLMLDEPTPDMRASFENGLRVLEAKNEAHGHLEGVFLAPGDAPGLTAELVRKLIQRFRNDPCDLLVPVFSSKRGHPLLMSATCARTVFELPAGVGVNAVFRSRPWRVVELAVADDGPLLDLDTPADAARHGLQFPD